jgi:hypothetical protein
LQGLNAFDGFDDLCFDLLDDGADYFLGYFVGVEGGWDRWNALVMYIRVDKKKRREDVLSSSQRGVTASLRVVKTSGSAGTEGAPATDRTDSVESVTGIGAADVNALKARVARMEKAAKERIVYDG